MIRRPPRSTRTDTLVPSTTLFRSFRYALLLMAGRHVERDKEKADEYMRKAAEAGNSSAQFNWAQILVSDHPGRSEEHTSELQSLMRISYAVFCLKKKNTNTQQNKHTNYIGHI